jgi:hypothetical protein
VLKFYYYPSLAEFLLVLKGKGQLQDETYWHADAIQSIKVKHMRKSLSHLKKHREYLAALKDPSALKMELPVV